MTEAPLERDVWTAGAADAPAVGQLLAEAFQDPVTRWLVPDPVDRAAIMPSFFGLVAQDALRTGTVDVYRDFAGAAVWFDLGDRERTEASGDAEAAASPADPATQGPDPRFDALMGRYAARWHTLAGTMDELHPEGPHDYLMLIGIRPHRQGSGIGSLLLRRHHARLRDRALPAYLEASSAESRRLYLRHGYHDLREPAHLPDGPPLWPMWRPADGGSA